MSNNNNSELRSDNRMERFLNGQTSPTETLRILEEAAFDPEMEKIAVMHRRLHYTEDLLNDYGHFIPAGSLAADDGQGLCDLQCEAYILRNEGITIDEDLLAEESKNNYWLREGAGTPLYKMGKLLEKKGFLVNRCVGASMEKLQEDLKDHSIIVVVNGDILMGKEPDFLSENFNMEDNPNHAIVVISVDEKNQTIRVFNPAIKDEYVDYSFDAFKAAWGESGNYEVIVRKKKFPEEYNPQPYDVSHIQIGEDLEDLVELLCENAHDVWGKRKRARNPEIEYAPLDSEGKEIPGKNHYYVPYEMLSEEDKDTDRDMVLYTVKLIKRLGFRIVNIKGMYKCPHCGTAIEPSDNFCRNCGEELTWETFR